MAYAGRLRPRINKKAWISKVEVCARVGKSVFFGYLKWHLIEIFPTNAPHGCIIDISNHYMKKTRRLSPILQIYS